jgi:hypothetical protein
MTDMSLQPPIYPRPGRKPSMIRVHLRVHQYKRLERYAANRNTTPGELMTRIVAAIIDDDLINAVLDDK